MLYVTSIRIDGCEQLIGEVPALCFTLDMPPMRMCTVRDGGVVEVRFVNKGSENLQVGLKLLYRVPNGERFMWDSDRLFCPLQISNGNVGVIVTEKLPLCVLCYLVIDQKTV